MKCKACNDDFTPYDYVSEDGITVTEDCCPACVGAAYDETYEPTGMPHDDDILQIYDISVNYFTFY